MKHYLRNPFKSPIEAETFSDWAKLFLDLSRAALLAVFAILFSEKTLIFKMLLVSLAFIAAWLLIGSARICRILGAQS